MGSETKIVRQHSTLFLKLIFVGVLLIFFVFSSGFACSSGVTRTSNTLTASEYLVTVGKGTSLLISSFCLVVALILTITLEIRNTRNATLHARMQACHLGSLATAEFLLAFAILIPEYFTHSICIGIGVVAHYCLLAAFAWLSAMCFNIWWTFKEIRPMAEMWQQRHEWLFLFLWGWGSPLVFSGISLTLDLVDHLPEGIVRPGYGMYNCWIAGPSRELTYVYIPVGILLLSNVLFFMLTAKELLCGKWRRDGIGQQTAGRESPALLAVCLKLFFVMGIAWVGEVASFISGGEHWFWNVTDAFNSLQGVVILCILSCRQRSWESIKRKCGFECCQKLRDATPSTSQFRIGRRKSTSTTQVEESYA